MLVSHGACFDLSVIIAHLCMLSDQCTCLGRSVLDRTAQGVKNMGLSSFGFGGTNTHLAAVAAEDRRTLESLACGG